MARMTRTALEHRMTEVLTLRRTGTALGCSWHVENLGRNKQMLKVILRTTLIMDWASPFTGLSKSRKEIYGAGQIVI